MDDFLVQAMREVDALTPACPQIAPKPVYPFKPLGACQPWCGTESGEYLAGGRTGGLMYLFKPEESPRKHYCSEACRDA